MLTISDFVSIKIYATLYHLRFFFVQYGFRNDNNRNNNNNNNNYNRAKWFVGLEQKIFCVCVCFCMQYNDSLNFKYQLIKLMISLAGICLIPQFGIYFYRFTFSLFNFFYFIDTSLHVFRFFVYNFILIAAHTFLFSTLIVLFIYFVWN